MNNKVIAIRKKLMVQRDELLSEAEHTISTKLGAEKQSFPDPTDQAAAELDNNFLLKLRGREQKLLKKIDEALPESTRVPTAYARPAADRSASSVSKRGRSRPSALSARPSRKRTKSARRGSVSAGTLLH